MGTHSQGTWKLGCVEQADRGLENQSHQGVGPLCSHKGLASVDTCCLPHTRRGRGGGRGKKGQLTNTHGAQSQRSLPNRVTTAGGYFPLRGVPKLAKGSGGEACWRM